MFNKNYYQIIKILFMITIYFSVSYINSFADIDAQNIINRFENDDKKQALTGQIDGFKIRRPNIEINLGKGELSLFDFGTGRYMAMVFKGDVEFKYTPPNEIEKYQLQRLLKRDSILSKLDIFTLFYTCEFDNFPDTSNFSRQELGGEIVDKLWESYKDALEYPNIYIAPFLLNDILAERIGEFLYADLDIGGVGHLAFIQNPVYDDKYSILRYYRKAGYKLSEVLAGYSDDNSLVSQRGVLSIDATHYIIKSVIEENDKMTVNCRIEFNPIRWGERNLYFECYKKEKIKSVIDSRGDTLYHYKQKEGVRFWGCLK